MSAPAAASSAAFAAAASSAAFFAASSSASFAAASSADSAGAAASARSRSDRTLNAATWPSSRWTRPSTVPRVSPAMSLASFFIFSGAMIRSRETMAWSISAIFASALSPAHLPRRSESWFRRPWPLVRTARKRSVSSARLASSRAFSSAATASSAAFFAAASDAAWALAALSAASSSRILRAFSSWALRAASAFFSCSSWRFIAGSSWAFSVSSLGASVVLFCCRITTMSTTMSSAMIPIRT